MFTRLRKSLQMNATQKMLNTAPVFRNPRDSNHNCLFMPAGMVHEVFKGEGKDRYLVSNQLRPQWTMLNCCGIKEIFGIDYCPPKTVLAEIVERYCSTPVSGTVTDGPEKGHYVYRYFLDLGRYESIHPFFVFSSGRNEKTPGVCEIIEKEKLGKLTILGPHRNPTGSPNLVMCIFEPNKKALRDWYVAYREELSLDKKEETDGEVRAKTAELQITAAGQIIPEGNTLLVPRAA